MISNCYTDALGQDTALTKEKACTESRPPKRSPMTGCFPPRVLHWTQLAKCDVRDHDVADRPSFSGGHVRTRLYLLALTIEKRCPLHCILPSADQICIDITVGLIPN